MTLSLFMDLSESSNLGSNMSQQNSINQLFNDLKAKFCFELDEFHFVMAAQFP